VRRAHSAERPAAGGQTDPSGKTGSAPTLGAREVERTGGELMGIRGRSPVDADVDVVVVGSGFGGSTAALRLTEKGYRVAVLEAGRRFDESTLPRTSWRVRSFFWAPRLGCYGIQRISLLKDVMILSGAGVGGGSLVYANTLYEPSPAFYADPQ